MTSKTGFSIQPKSLYKSHPYNTQPNLRDTLKKEQEEHPKHNEDNQHMFLQGIHQQNLSKNPPNKLLDGEPSQKIVLKKYTEVLHPRDNQQGKLIKYRRIMPDNIVKTASRGFLENSLSCSKRKSKQKTDRSDGTLSHRCSQKSPPLNLEEKNDTIKSSRIKYPQRRRQKYLEIEDIIFDKKNTNKK